MLVIFHCKGQSGKTKMGYANDGRKGFEESYKISPTVPISFRCSMWGNLIIIPNCGPYIYIAAGEVT